MHNEFKQTLDLSDGDVEMQFDIACQHLQKDIVLNPSNAKFRHSLGCAYEAVEQCQKAVDAFQHAVNKDPFHTQFLMSLVKPLSYLKIFMRVVMNHYKL